MRPMSGTLRHFRPGTRTDVIGCIWYGWHANLGSNMVLDLQSNILAKQCYIMPLIFEGHNVNVLVFGEPKNASNLVDFAESPNIGRN